MGGDDDVLCICARAHMLDATQRQWPLAELVVIRSIASHGRSHGPRKRSTISLALGEPKVREIADIPRHNFFILVDPKFTTDKFFFKKRRSCLTFQWTLKKHHHVL